MRVVPILLLSLVLCAGVACSSFKSSSSPSRWSSNSIKASSSPSRWSSESSGGEAPAEEVEADESADTSRYERDVRDTTVSIVRSGGLPGDVSRAIHPVAYEYGITDFADDPGTYRAIGRGLGLADLSLDEFDRYREQLARGSDVKRQLLLEGYTSAR